MPVNHNRPQSGMFDSHGDGHPPREAYLTPEAPEPAAEQADDVAPAEEKPNA
jgi:hypothetical protein